MNQYLKNRWKLLKAVWPALLLFFLFIACESKEYKTVEITEISQNHTSKSLITNQSDIKNENDFDSNNTTLTSWNIQDLGRTKNPQEIHGIANILRDFDIVALQEIVAKDPAGAQAVAKIVDELNRMGSKWDYRISNPTKRPSVYISERYAYLWKTSKVRLIHRAYLDEELEEICNREPFIAAFKIKGKSEPFYIVAAIPADTDPS